MRSSGPMRLSTTKSAIHMVMKEMTISATRKTTAAEPTIAMRSSVGVALRIGQERRIEIVGGRGRAGPGRDRENFAGEAADHRQYGRKQNDADDNTVENRNGHIHSTPRLAAYPRLPVAPQRVSCRHRGCDESKISLHPALVAALPSIRRCARSDPAGFRSRSSDRPCLSAVGELARDEALQKIPASRLP